MPNNTGTGASDVSVSSFKCSVEKITVSTKWKAPLKEVSENIEAVAFDSANAKECKTLYLITSPDGKKVTLKFQRDEGQCTRSSHANYTVKWDEYEEQENPTESVSYDRTESHINTKGLLIAAGKDILLSSVLRLPCVLPINLIKTPKKIEEPIKGESIHEIKCFEIGGLLDALKYWNLPIPMDTHYVTRFSHTTCKEGVFSYQIVSYPDIKFTIELSIGIKKENKDSNNKGTDSSEGFVLPYKICRPKFEAKTTFNHENYEAKLKADFNKDSDEYVSFTYIKNGHVLTDLSSAGFQQIKKIKKPLDFLKALAKIGSNKVIGDFLAFDVNTIPKDKRHKVVDIKPVYPNGSIKVEGAYRTSKDLTQIGRYVTIKAALDPLIGVDFKLDILYIILNCATGGAATGIYMLAKNLKEVLKSVLDNEYDELPVNGDAYINLEIKGLFNINFNFVIDSIKDNDKHHSQQLEAFIKLDLDAGINLSLQIFYFITAAIDFSIGLHTGFKFIAYLQYLGIKEGLSVPFEILFNGLKITYTAKANVGLKKVKVNDKGRKGLDIEDEKKLMDKKTLMTTKFGPFFVPKE